MTLAKQLKKDLIFVLKTMFWSGIIYIIMGFIFNDYKINSWAVYQRAIHFLITIIVGFFLTGGKAKE